MSPTSIDPIDLLEADIDRRMREKMPREFAAMVEARRRRNGESEAEPTQRVLRLQPAPTDDKIETMIGGLMPLLFLEAAKSLELARRSAATGELVAVRDAYVNQGARLSVALATLSEALRRRRGKVERMVIEHRHHHLHQRIP
jgi:hypothetical protein